MQKGDHSSLWIAVESPEATAAELARFEQVGVEEIFVEAANVLWSGGRPELEPLSVMELPRRSSATLVVRGDWPAGGPAASAAGNLAAARAGLAPQLRSQGLEPVGFHLDLDVGESLEAYGSFLGALREEISEGFFLSASLRYDQVPRPGAQAVADAVDFLVAFLYGQRPGEADDTEAWHLNKVETNLNRLERMGCDYLIGVVTVGRALHEGSGDALVGESTRLTLGELVRHPDFELSRGFTLEGIDRQSYRFQAASESKVGGLTVQTGDSVRLVYLGSHHLEEFERRVGARILEHRLGELYYRLPQPDEGLSLSVRNLLNALSREVATAIPRVTLEEIDPAPDDETADPGRPRYFQLSVINESEEPTDISQIGSNYVELAVENGYVYKVDPGEFHRWELLQEDPRGDLVRAFRQAPVVRLYVPLLEPWQWVKSGAIEVQPLPPPEPRRDSFGRPIEEEREQPEITATPSGSFILPDGRQVAAEISEPEVEEEGEDGEGAEEGVDEEG